MTPREQAHLHVLRLIEDHPGITQRRLAEQLGVSIGKIHYLLHALLNKGLIKAQSALRSSHRWAYLYTLTPSGLDAKLQLARAYLVRKEAEYEALRAEIADLRTELGVSNPALRGKPVDAH